MLTKKELRFLRELVRLKIDFMLIGQSAAILQGAPGVTQDVDLWFSDLSDPKITKALKIVKSIYVPTMGDNPPMFAGDDVELFDIVTHVQGIGEYDEVKKQAIKIKLDDFEVLVLPLELIIKSKEAAGRNKDKASLPMLRDAMKIIKSIKK